jgi:D-glycero-beta-D-manno-heptose 1-phosphate adenylyltransferase
MSNKAIFLDRDGTLTEDKGFTHKADEFKLLSNVIEGLKKLSSYKHIIITNQGGIAAGKYSEKDMHEFNDRLAKELLSNKIKIEKTYYCPHISEDNCECRKPKPKLIYLAKKEFDIDLKKSWVIGDKASDIELAMNAGVKAVFVLTGEGPKHLAKARVHKPGYVAADISRAADFITFSEQEKIIDNREIGKLSDKLKAAGKKIVTLNGTFDILHNGHDYMVSEAKKQGDVLIVGVNSDSSVRQNKGKDRPINNEKARQMMIANYKEVDYVTFFEETTPINLLEKIKPDIHVNGSEYGEKCIEAGTVKKYGGRIHIVKLLPGYSSTKIINGE